MVNTPSHRLNTSITNHDQNPLSPKQMERFTHVDTPAQGNLKLKPEMTPLALLYLLSIYNGDFDKRLHAGHFSSNVYFKERIKDLMDMGFITYDGQHALKPKGAEHVSKLLEIVP